MHGVRCPPSIRVEELWTVLMPTALLYVPGERVHLLLPVGVISVLFDALFPEHAPCSSASTPTVRTLRVIRQQFTLPIGVRTTRGGGLQPP